jgi:hypothetical protein
LKHLLDQLKEDDPEAMLKIVQRILNTPFWLPTIDTQRVYQLTSDDSRDCWLTVSFGIDGDGYIKTYSENMMESVRLRMPMMGGGQYPRTRQALLILAEAIRLDTEGKAGAQ